MRLRPRVLNDISNVDTRVTLLGSTVPTPILVAPTGRHKLFNAEGERATAYGASVAGAAYVMASNANVTIENVAAERRGAPQWFQLYYWPNRAEVEALIDRVAAAGFTALVLTVDAPVGGWSPRGRASSMSRHPTFLTSICPARRWRELSIIPISPGRSYTRLLGASWNGLQSARRWR